MKTVRQFIRLTVGIILIAILLPPPSLGADDKKGDKKPEKLKIERLTQGMGLYTIGPVCSDGKSILLLAQKPDAAPNLYVMNLADRSIRPPLTSYKWGVSEPRWSPDCQSVAFAAAHETATFSEIYVMELKGGTPRRVTQNQFNDKEPVFSPDGKRLLFTSDESPLPDAAFGILHIASASVAGGKPEFFTEDEVSTIHPGISPDGKAVMLVKIDDNSGRHSLWLYGFDGKPLRDLTGRKFARIHNYIVNRPEQTIVLWAQEEPEQQEGIYILDLKSGEARELPEPDLPKRSPALSPDGKLIAFISPTDTGTALFLYDSATQQIQQLTFKGVNTHSPVFVSNKEILFGSDRDRANELYLIDLVPPPPPEEKKKK